MLNALVSLLLLVHIKSYHIPLPAVNNCHKFQNNVWLWLSEDDQTVKVGPGKV